MRNPFASIDFVHLLVERDVTTDAKQAGILTAGFGRFSGSSSHFGFLGKDAPPGRLEKGQTPAPHFRQGNDRL